MCCHLKPNQNPNKTKQQQNKTENQQTRAKLESSLFIRAERWLRKPSNLIPYSNAGLPLASPDHPTVNSHPPGSIIILQAEVDLKYYFYTQIAFCSPAAPEFPAKLNFPGFFNSPPFYGTVQQDEESAHCIPLLLLEKIGTKEICSMKGYVSRP